MKNTENIKFSSRNLSHSVIFIEKIQILRKMTKSDLFSVYILENIKFSNGMHYRSVSFIEKLQISRKITNFSENEQI